MLSFHSTLSRREFMKGLGLAGAGLGAVAVAAPAFHDLDEMISSTPKVHDWPWWIKETDYDKTTVEIDWPKVSRWDARHILQCGWQGRNEGYAWLNLRDGAGTSEKIQKDAAQRKEQGLKSNDPFYDVRNLALTGVLFGPGLGFMSESPNGFLGPAVAGPDAFGFIGSAAGASKWTGTPEEASIMLRQVMVLLGASDIGIVELNPSTTRNMIFRNDFFDGKPYTFEDVDKAFETGETTAGPAGPAKTGKRVIPNKCRWLVRFSFDESSQWLGRFAEEGGLRYPEGRQIQLRSQAFIKGLGYQALGPMMYTNNLSENVGLAVLSGQGELGRNNMAISPSFGAVCGQCSSIITDLPLAPTKPIDAGIREFCITCMKCAEFCPGGALSRQGDPGGPIVKEPTWESIGPWQRWPGRTAYEAKTPGVFRQEPGTNEAVFYKHWWYAWPDCLDKYDICGTWGCGVSCPFKDGNEASVHDIVMATAAVTPLFNGFFRSLDDTFGYDAFRMKEPDYIEMFWNGKANIPRFGTETSNRWRK